MKTCKYCGAIKSIADFYANPAGRDGTRPECKDCTRARRKCWYRENREREIERVSRRHRDHPEMLRARMDAFTSAGKKKASDRKSCLKRKYGLTLEASDARAICGIPDAHHVDHDHRTGQVRGILCFRCNVAIGLLDDDELAELAELARPRAVALTA